MIYPIMFYLEKLTNRYDIPEYNRLNLKDEYEETDANIIHNLKNIIVNL